MMIDPSRTAPASPAASFRPKQPHPRPSDLLVANLVLTAVLVLTTHPLRAHSSDLVLADAGEHRVCLDGGMGSFRCSEVYTDLPSLAGVAAADGAEEPETRAVVLLHGLARSSASMQKMQRALEEAGFATCNIDYPSTKHRIETLAREHILPEIKACVGTLESPIDFVTHSMGGILVRYIAEHGLLPRIGRVVMLSPPNGGSEVVDTLGESWFFEFVNGPAGQELGTDSASVPLQLGPAAFEVGIITGSRSINPMLSLMIAGRDDGKVSIARAKLAGMQGFLVLPTSHPFIMKNKRAIAQTIAFLESGAFRED